MTKPKRLTRRLGSWLLVGGAAVLALLSCRPKPEVVAITGVVLLQDPDLADQVPIAGAEIRAAIAGNTVSGKSDATGLFRVTFRPGTQPGSVALNVQHPGYQAVQLTLNTPGELVVVRMRSSAPPMTARERREETVIDNVRIRYSGKSTRTTNIGSLAKTFQVSNTGNVPCNGVPPCSPDGRWKASMGGYSADAGPGNEYRNVRLACIAGPCPFTRQSEAQTQNGRMLNVSVQNWSDTTTFLLEAEVSQTRMSDIILQSYPATAGSTMSFTLPGAAEGPSIEAELNGHDIVFPMGPDLILSWANCTVSSSSDQGSLFRCELKAGYRFKS